MQRHEDWMRQACRDLKHAEHALEDADYEGACFAAQQAAEKAIKGGRPLRMPPRSSSSASVTFLDKQNVIAELKAVAQRIRSKDPNVLEVSLFGSFATNRYAPGSDADILIVLREDSRRFLDRIPPWLAQFQDISLPVEVFPYTREELDRMHAAGNPFIRRILAERIPF